MAVFIVALIAVTLPDVVAVTPLPGHRLRLRFEDGVTGVGSPTESPTRAG